MLLNIRKKVRGLKDIIKNKIGRTRYAINRRRYNIGKYSYKGKNARIVNSKETVIGKYTSIADYVQLGLSQHPVNFLSTHPFQYVEFSLLYSGGKDGILITPASRVINISKTSMLPVRVGNDVWIGYGAMVMDGVSIGDGAIIGAGAVVTKDVPPYAVAAGVPAKVIKYRFDENTIRELLEIKWWDYPEEIITNLPFDNVKECIRILKEKSSEKLMQ